MSTLHKVKAYFGMAPIDDYDDEYYEDDRDGAGRGRGFSRGGERFATDGYEAGYEGGRYDERDPRDFGSGYGDERGPDYPPTGGYRVGYGDDSRMRPREFNDMPRSSRFGALRGSTRGALAMDPRRMALLFEEGSPLSKITTLRPKDYNEARTIGERFRDGQPVIMDLVSMDNADAKRLVDFAAGLAFALRGSFDKVATKVFLLAPADVDVSADERRRIAEAGFYSYQ
ncbi:cell division protein SepF [Mycolicibacterium sp.]|jgi:cell division inhibitor SepF|uniref:cell division protein SepF n=1 Tax=Mycolicibacterium sp. TaxID=2320850 RepID=UPI001A340BF5|nr:cell division protein SepF [Mycolicibacterium sp.]MBJ7398947.1 cell division protein SepF [Mycolicibacterium sp.]